MRSSEYTRDHSGERRPSGLAGLLAKFGEEVAAEPENLEGALGRLARGTRVLFEAGAIELSATIGEVAQHPRRRWLIGGRGLR